MKGLLRMLQDFWCALTGKCDADKRIPPNETLEWLKVQQEEAEKATVDVKNRYVVNSLERELLRKRLESRMEREGQRGL